jgi:hypothetical protein
MLILSGLNNRLSALIHYVKRRTPLSHLSNGANLPGANNGMQLNTLQKGIKYA